MIRNPAVAGQFYSSSAKALIEDVKGMLEEVDEKVDAKGIVSPHAGLIYSGKVAGAVYSRIKSPDTYILIGPNHQGIGPDFGMIREGLWNMPLGEVKVDKLLADEIFKHSSLIEDDPFVQGREHSLEVQLPFMQYFSDSFQIVPITVLHYSPDENFLKSCVQVGETIAKAVSALDEWIIFN
jgi:hypothetical protein